MSGPRGPAPIPTAILEARGSWRAKERAGEPTLPVEVPPCPAWLNKTAKVEWRRQVKALVAMGCIAKCDRGALALYCDAWATVVEYRRLLRAVDPVSDEAKRLAVVFYKAADVLIKIAGQFGFTPAARARLRTVEQPKKDETGKGRFFASNN